jgi:hypothetical protein
MPFQTNSLDFQNISAFGKLNDFDRLSFRQEQHANKNDYGAFVG